MTNIAIIGANGRSAREIIPRLSALAYTHLTLFLRHADQLKDFDTTDARIVEGDAHDPGSLDVTVANQDVVVIALGGTDLDVTTRLVVEAAQRAGVTRIIAINAGGIYDELPEPFNAWDDERAGHTRPTNLRAAEAIEQSGLQYTVLRPVWLTNKSVTAVELTQKGEVFKGTETSRASLGQFIADIVADGTHINENIGITQPGTDGDKPAPYR
ncbi:NAD(P)H-binding protein [Microbacterium sp. ISL-103]|uniref:NAD(P)H-binding protein n=1 Tax=Microbacterium sp. ISL-103 TaxID=2819156 RepID=UPI001BEB9909|nr:NAD(P)H-binding protein [Microbacterium sp. ISL-103]MBT2474666.1 NAD(P)H-binding protein [Microbacterium sp. ISL-103]